MIETQAPYRFGWLSAAGLAGLALLVVFATPVGFGVGRMTQEAAFEYCRAEVTRGFLVKYQASGHRDFKTCMTAQGY
jgi:hypothetical protein